MYHNVRHCSKIQSELIFYFPVRLHLLPRGRNRQLLPLPVHIKWILLQLLVTTEPGYSRLVVCQDMIMPCYLQGKFIFLYFRNLFDSSRQFVMNKRQRIPKEQLRLQKFRDIDNIGHTSHRTKTSKTKNTTHYKLNTMIRKQTQIT